jgi:hypothetical protein
MRTLDVDVACFLKIEKYWIDLEEDNADIKYLFIR